MPADQPIFVLGIMPRSGTNYLSDLLCLHPDCAAPSPILEDYLVHHGHYLADYVHAVSSSWQPRWGVDRHDEDQLWQALGEGLKAFLAAKADAPRIVTKTPSVGNLQQFFRLFPDAQLLVLIRDGRAVVESAVRSFGVSYEWWMHRWATAAQNILDFEHVAGSCGSYRIVRYEALWSDLHEEMPKVLTFLGLDSSVYDFDAAANLPVRGSSEFASGRAQTIDWTPLEKPADFDPTLRFHHWKQSRQSRFDWIAGRVQTRLGYESHASHRPANALWNVVLDACWLVRGGFHAMAMSLRSRFSKPGRHLTGEMRLEARPDNRRS